MGSFAASSHTSAFPSHSSSTTATRDSPGAASTTALFGSLRIGLDALIGFGSAPLQLMSAVGLAVADLSFVLGAWYVAQKLMGFDLTPGLPTTVLVVTFFAGVQLLSLGVMGEYVGRIYDEVKRRLPACRGRRRPSANSCIIPERPRLSHEIGGSGVLCVISTRPMRVLVTGGAGFIGGHSVRALLDRGHRITVVDDLSRGRRQAVPERAELVVTDIRAPELLSIFNSSRFDAVLHLAAQMDVRRSVAEPLYDASVNVLGTLNVLEAARRTDVKRFVFASSGGAIYGARAQVCQRVRSGSGPPR
jgi:hypothetical protein